MEKKNLAVFVDTTNAIQATDDALSAFTAGRVALISAEDQQATASGDITALTMGNGVQVAMLKADGEYLISDVIDARNIQMLTQQAAISAAGQVTTIDAISNIDCETEYCVTINYHSPVIAKNYGYQAMKKTYSYVTRCCGTACGCPDGAVWDVSMGLAEQINNDLESQMNLTAASAKTVMYAKVLNSTAVVTANDPVEAWTFTKGSNKVATADAAQHGSNVSLVAGDFVRAMDGGGTVTVAAGDVFRVESIDSSTQFTIDRPWPYATHTMDTTGDCEVILKATGEALAESTWSIETSFADGASTDGIVDDSGAGSMTYVAPYVVTAEVGLGCNLDCNATVTTGTDAAQPELIGYSVINEELWANKGASKKFGPYAGTTLYSRPVSGEDYFATAATNYTFCFTIDYIDTFPSASTDSFMPRPKRIKIYTTGTTCSNEWNAIFDSLNVDFDVPFKLLG